MVATWLFGIGLLFLLIIICSIVLFYHTDDIWLKFLWAVTALSTFIFFVPYAYQMNQVQMGVGSDLSIVTLDSLDINNLVFDGVNVLNDNETYLLAEFSNINGGDLGNVVESSFCFYFNNSDADNVVFVGSADDCGVFDVSRPLYLNVTSESFMCVDFSSDLVVDNALFGVICRDCNGSNTLDLLTASGISVNSFLVNVNDDNDYSIVGGSPNAFWLEFHSLPTDSVISWFWSYLWWFGFLSLFFGLYLIVKIISLEMDVMTK